MSSDIILRLANNFTNIIGVKEASGDMIHIMEIINNRPDDFLVISGDDALTLPIINMGGDGVISVVAQAYPKEYSYMVQKGMSGDFYSANRQHYDLWNYYKPLYKEGNPAGVKALLELLGFCKRNVRKPLLPASQSIMIELTELLQQ
jgi:4-hydroxy-tetrahydrodipicolinate synthase